MIFNTRNLFLLTIICLPYLGLSQPVKRGSVEYLKYVNGFNNIKLGDDITPILNSKLEFLDGDSRQDAEGCYKYEYTDTSVLNLPDGTDLDLIAIRTYKNKIVNIYVFFRRNDGYRILSNFLANYGACTDRPNSLTDIYSWNSHAIDLSLKYQADAVLGIAVFTNKTLEAQILTDKQQKTEAETEAITLTAAAR